jgi:hypothetical protein
MFVICEASATLVLQPVTPHVKESISSKHYSLLALRLINFSRLRLERRRSRKSQDNHLR